MDDDHKKRRAEDVLELKRKVTHLESLLARDKKTFISAMKMISNRAERWQGRFHTLRLENNKLRKKLYRQIAVLVDFKKDEA